MGQFDPVENAVVSDVNKLTQQSESAATPPKVNQAKYLKPFKNPNAKTPNLPAPFDPSSKDSLDYYSKLLSTRLDKVNWWKDDPITAAWLTGSTLPEHHFQHLANHLPTVNQWVNSETSLGGVPGALKAAYVKTTKIADPQARINAVSTLDALRALPPDEQQAFIAMVKGQAYDPALAAQAIGQATMAPDTQYTPSEQAPFTLGQDANTNFAASLEAMFPELQGKLHFTAGGITKDDIAMGLASSPLLSTEASSVLNQPLEKPLNWGSVALGYGEQLGLDTALFYGAMGAAPGALGGLAAGGFGTAASVGSSLVGGSLLASEVGVPGGIGPTSGPGSTILHAGFAPFRLLNNTLAVAAHGVGQVVKVVDPNASDQTVNVVGNIILAVAFHEANEGLHTFFTSPSSTPEAALGEAGGRPAIPTYSESIANVDPVNRLLHPIKTYLDPLVNEVAAKAANSTGYADMMASKSFTRLYDIAAAIQKEGKPLEAQIGELTDRYPALSKDTARIVLSVERDAMPAAVSDFVRNPHPMSLEDANIEVKAAEQRVMDALHGQAIAMDRQISGGTGPDGFTVDLAGKLLDRTGNSVGDINPKDITWVRTEDLMNNVDTRLPRTTSAEPGSTMEDYANQIRDSKNFPKPVEVLVDEAGRVHVQDGNHTLEAAAAAGVDYTPVVTVRPGEVPEEATLQQRVAIGDVISADNLSQIYPDRFQSFDPSTEQSAEAARVDEARAALHEAEIAAMDAAQHVEPQWQLPTGNRLPDYLHRAMMDPRTTMEHVINRIIGFSPSKTIKSFTNRIFNTDFVENQSGMLTRLTDKMAASARENRLFPPSTARSDAELAYINDHNTTYINRFLTRLGVPNELIHNIQGRLLSATSTQEWYQIVSQELFGSKGLVSAYLPKNLAPDVRSRILSISANDPLNYTVGVPVDMNGRTISEPILSSGIRNGVPDPLPFLDNEFIHGVQLPAEDDLQLATSAIKRAAANNKAFGMIYGGMKFTLDASRLALKPLTLVASLPAVILHKLADETLGNVLMPDIMNPVASRGTLRSIWENLSHPSKWGTGLPWGQQPLTVMESMRDMTSRTLGAAADPTAETTSVEVSANKLLSSGNSTDRAVAFRGILGVIDHFRESDIARILAANGLDEAGVQAAVTAMTGGDVVLTKFYEDNIKPNLERAGMDLRTALQRTAESMRYATFGGNPAWLKYIATDQFDTGIGTHWPEGTSISQDYEHITSRVDAIRTELGREDPRTPEGQAHIAALQDQLLQDLNRLDSMEAHAKANGIELTRGVGRRFIPHTNSRGLVAAMDRQFLANEISLPDVIRIRKAMADPYLQMSSMDNIRQALARVSEAGYRPLRFIGKAEGLFARGSYYNQRFEALTSEFQARGMPREEARAFAAVKATNETTDIFYDLSARSTLEKQTRNLFWFAPVTGELLYRWSYAIPAATGNWAVGAALTAARVTNYIQLFKNLGVLKDAFNPVTGKKELSVQLPGVARFINFLTGSDLKENPYLPISGVFSHISSPIPTLSVVPSALLDKEIAPHIPAIQGLANVLAPFDTIGFVPSSVANLAGVFGIKLPDFSPDYVDSKWNRTHDLALQYAWTKMYQAGDTQPDPEKFGLVSTPDKGYVGQPGQEQAYHDAWNAWFARLQSQANTMSKGLYLMGAFDSLAVPGSLNYSTEEQRNFTEFFQTKVIPKLQPGQPLPPAIQEQLQLWESRHPESLAFTVSQGQYTGKTIPPTMIDSGFDYRTLYLSDIKRHMDPRDYADVLAAMTSKAQLTGRLNAAVAAVAGTGTVPEQVVNTLKNWGQRSQAVADYNNNFNNYLALHHEIRDVLNLNQDRALAAYGKADTQGVESQYVAAAMGALSQLKGLFVGNGGITTDEYKTVLADLKAARADLYTQTNGQLTPYEKGLDHFFTNVLTPYMNATAPLYDQASQITAAGGDASAVYSQIDALKKQYTGLTWKGVTLPGPDEFFYGNKPGPEQKVVLTHWASQPISWLSDWQRTQMGYSTFPNEDQFWKSIDDITSQAQGIIDSRGLSPGSKGYDAIQKWEQNAKNAVAQQYGQDAVNNLALDQAAPAYRIQVTNRSYTKNASWNTIMQMVTYTTQRLQALGESPKGSSADALALKSWVYTELQQLERTDPEFAQIMEHISLATNIQSKHPTGVPLYEAIFFNQYVPQYIDSNLMSQFVPQEGIT